MLKCYYLTIHIFFLKWYEWGRDKWCDHASNRISSTVFWIRQKCAHAKNLKQKIKVSVLGENVNVNLPVSVNAKPSQ